MNAEIQAKDSIKKDSEGQTISMEGVQITTHVREEAGLPLGEPREQFQLIIEGEKKDGTIDRKLHLEFDCHEIEKIVESATNGGMMPKSSRDHVLKLLSQLQREIETL